MQGLWIDHDKVGNFFAKFWSVSRFADAQELLAEASRLLELLHSTTMCSGACRAYSPCTHAKKEEDGLLLEFPCNPTRTRSV
jgi:hypothetical protein